MKQSVLRFAAQLWAMLAVLLLFVAAALPAHADDGDMDEITHYTVTVDTRADGSADITYELDWNVIGGSLDEPLTWVRDRLIAACGSGAHRPAQQPQRQPGQPDAGYSS